MESDNKVNPTINHPLHKPWLEVIVMLNHPISLHFQGHTYLINHCRGWLVLGYEILPANLLLSRMEHPPFKVMFFPARKLHWLKIVHCNVWYPSNAHPKSTLYQLYPHDTIIFDGWTSRIPICVAMFYGDIPSPEEPVIDLIQFPLYSHSILIIYIYSHVLCPYFSPAWGGSTTMKSAFLRSASFELLPPHDPPIAQQFCRSGFLLKDGWSAGFEW